MGWEKYQIIAASCFDEAVDIRSYPVILLRTSLGIFACDVCSDKKSQPGRVKYGPGIDLKVLLLSSQQLFIILNRQKSCGKEYGAPSSVHALRKVSGRIHAPKPYQKTSVFRKLAVDNIFAVHLVVDHKESVKVKVKE